ncbi:MAG: DUF4406 domain-containing protein [bacterium]|nr:DUF4406 domain-containing protein [bacterium]
MIKVYIAGAITPTGKGNHAIEYLSNVREGIRAAVELLKRGYAPFCPHIDLHYILSLYPGEEITSEMIYELSREWLSACDVVFLLPNAENSVGWAKERKLAESLNIPIVLSIEEIKEVVKR